jgi:protein involved in polysaccharide export with SLBB domain
MKSYFTSIIILLVVFLFQLFAQDFRLSSQGQFGYPAAVKGKTSSDKVAISVDPAVYLLGPGDALEIRSSKMPWVVYSGTVNESNKLYIPEFGTFEVNKKTLNDAKKEIATFIQLQKPREEIDIILSSPKEVEVVVAGEAVNSGSYRLSGTLRVLDAVKIALKDSVVLFRDINYRNVAVTIQGETIHCDLAGFIAHGDGLENPYLYSGAIISLTPPVRWVTISGAVSSPFSESLPINADDIYGQLFKICKVTEDADTSNVMMFRKGQKTVRYTLATIASLMVEDLDYIIVGSLKPVKKTKQVAIKGEIKNPGTYPLEEGKTSLVGSVIAIAGGITDKADSGRIYIMRKDPLATASARLAKELGNQSQKKDPVSQRMITSGDYRIIPINAFSSNELENDDLIVVPEISRTVYVSGDVKMPGAYPFAKHRSLKYYVDLAGGFSRMADKRDSKVVTAYGDFWVVKNAEIEAGDIIVVPERPQNQKTQRYDLVIKTLYYAGTSILAFISIGKALDLIREE